jgi:hypothetical protein
MSDALARPPGFTGFVVRQKFTRIEFDEPGYEGLWAEVRTNLTHEERDAFVSAMVELDDHSRDDISAATAQFKLLFAAVDEAKDEKARQKAIAARDAHQTARFIEARGKRRERYALVAPYIRAWNVYADDVTPVSPQDVDAALAYTDDAIVRWLITTCSEGYKGGKGVRPSSSKPDDVPEPTSEPNSESETES